MLSRVVPASLATIVSRRLRTALNKLDLPTLARPTIATTGNDLPIAMSCFLAEPETLPLLLAHYGVSCLRTSFTVPLCTTHSFLVASLPTSPTGRQAGQAGLYCIQMGNSLFLITH